MSKMKLLLTSIGKRVELIKHLKTQFEVLGADCSDFNPARYFVDSFYKIPRADKPEYLDSILEICNKEKVNYVVPLYEGEFPVLSSSADKFSKLNTVLLLSDRKVIDICKDKYQTAYFFEFICPVCFRVRHGFGSFFCGAWVKDRILIT